MFCNAHKAGAFMVIAYSELPSYITLCNIIIFLQTLRLPCLQRTETNVESTCVLFLPSNHVPIVNMSLVYFA